MNTRQVDIMDAAASLFSSQGIRNTTMDEIAAHCGVSKKTLYHFFSDKRMLVMSIVQNLVSRNEQVVRLGPVISPNAAADLVAFFQYVQNRLDTLTPWLLRDIKKYYHDAYALLQLSKDKRLIPYLHQNLTRGMAEEIYRSDIDSHVAGWLYFWQLENAMEEVSLHNDKRFALVHHINSIFLHGIVTAKGEKLLFVK